MIPKTPSGDCVFLDKDNRCRIHTEFGEQSKPLACRIFPFSVRPVPRGWQGSLRFDCPSMTASTGQPIREYEPWLVELANELPYHVAADEEAVDLQKGVRATREEINLLTDSLATWFAGGELSVWDRLIGAAKLTQTFFAAKLTALRGERFGELLDLLVSALPADRGTPLPEASSKQRGMLRQLVFAHAEHVSVYDLRSGMIGRLRKQFEQLGKARRFLKGKGLVPVTPGSGGETTFELVEAVKPDAATNEDVEDLLLRYVSARLEGQGVFGNGYYGWPVFEGLAALWLAIASAGWLARCSAAGDQRHLLNIYDVHKGLGIVDRAATRLPSLGTSAERLRLKYVLIGGGAVGLLADYLPMVDNS